MNPYLDNVISLIDDHLKDLKKPMKWMWGEALLGYALLLLDEHLSTHRYESFIKSYLDHYLKHTPNIDQSDTFAPILVSYTYDKNYHTQHYKTLTDKGLNYFLNAEPVIDFLPNHLGHSFVGKLYPKSIWVDSMMMYGFFLSFYGKHENDDNLSKLSVETILKFNTYLQKDGFWHHAYWTKSKKAFPKNLYWGRGNGWVMTSLPMIIENVSKENQEKIIPIYKKTVESMVKSHHEGLYQTILNQSSPYESSANFLIFGGMIKGYLLGLVDKKTVEFAKEGYEKAFSTFVKTKHDQLKLTKVSNPTIPLYLLPKLGYMCIGFKDNWSYGLAALIFASIAYDKLIHLNSK